MKKFNTKKIIALLLTLCMIFALVACGSGGTGDDSDLAPEEDDKTLEEVEMTLELSYGERTGIYSGEINEDGLPDGYGIFSSENEAGEVWTYEGDWENGHMSGQGTSVWETGQVYTGEFFNDMENGTGIKTFENGCIFEGEFIDGDIGSEGKFTWENGDVFEGEFIDGDIGSEGKLTLADGGVYEGHFSSGRAYGDGKYTFPDGTVYEGSFLSADIRGYGTIYYTDGSYYEANFRGYYDATGTYYDSEGIRYLGVLEDGEMTLTLIDDFFADEERQERFESLYQSYNFDELYEYVENYISESAISEEDSAYSIIEIIEPLLAAQDYWTINYDSFDGSCTVGFEGATEISSSNSVVVTVDGTDIDIKIGFRKNGWLFFDKYYLSVDGEQVDSGSVKSYNTTRNVIGGGTIEEFCFASLSSSGLEKIGGAETVILRFENSDSKEQYDHTLTEAEKNSLYYGSMLRTSCRSLQNMLSDYNRAMKALS